MNRDRPRAARRPSTLSVLLPAILLIAGLLPTAAAADDHRDAVVVFTGATLHPVDRPPIEDGALVVRGTDIAFAGARADLPTDLPADARRIALDGKHLYPGFIHVASELGLIEINSVRGSVDTDEIGEVRSDLRARSAYNADSLLISAARVGGIVAAHVRQSGGMLPGVSTVLRTAGWNWDDATVRAETAMQLQFPTVSSPSNAGDEAGSSARVMLLNEVFDAARSTAAADNAPPPRNRRLAALAPVLDGRLALHVAAYGRWTIGAALDWLEAQALTANAVLISTPAAAAYAERLAALGIPVILDGVLAEPDLRDLPYDDAYTAAARLHEAGVAIAIGNGGSASDARNVPFNAAMAAAFGLPKDVALRSVTLSAAEILGVADRLGSLTAGKEASFLVTDGDPLEIVTRIEQVWIAGAPVDFTTDHQLRLYERYRNRPAPAAP
ncbi:MAG: amidohydrolase family protein [Acidobacteriota bacterium]